jgi:hypothetical protein
MMEAGGVSSNGTTPIAKLRTNIKSMTGAAPRRNTETFRQPGGIPRQLDDPPRRKNALSK